MSPDETRDRLHQAHALPEATLPLWARTVRRNERCPCGSGRKRKLCCERA